MKEKASVGGLNQLNRLRVAQGGYMITPRGAISPKVEQRTLEIMHTIENTNSPRDHKAGNQSGRMSTTQAGFDR